MSQRLTPASALLIVLVPLALAFAVYAPRLGDYFALDDFIWLQAVQDRGPWSVVARAVTFPETTAFESPTPFWRPASDVVFYIEHQLFGLHAMPYHAVNVALHGLVAGLVGLLVARFTRSAGTGLAVSAIVAVAPTYDYAVTWISQFSELLAATFSITALLAYHACLTDRNPQRAQGLYIIALFALALALLSKESAVVTLPLLAALVFAVPDDERLRSVRAIVVDFVPITALAAAYGAFLFVVEYLEASSGNRYELGPHIVENMWAYLRRMAFPYASHSAWVGTAQVWAAAGYLGLGAWSVGARRWLLAYLFLWSLLALVPFSLFPGGIEWRYTYLATLPFVAFLAAAATEFIRSLPEGSRSIAAIACAAIAVMAVAVAPAETRARQTSITVQARGYESMLDEVRRTCAGLPPEGYIYIVGTPTWDWYGFNTNSAVNLFFDRVYVTRAEPAQLAALLEPKCIVRL